jgi:hypothetical protein
VAPNAEAAFVAHFATDGQCDFNHFFFEPSGRNELVVPTRLGAMDVNGNSLWVTSHGSAAGADRSVLSQIVPDASEPVGWQYEWVSDDQTPVLGTSLEVRGDFVYASLTYSTQVEMSLEVDFVGADSLTTQACTTSSCNDAGLLWKARLPTD